MITHCGLVIWHFTSGSTLIEVLACCLMTPSPYLNQCWLFIIWDEQMIPVLRNIPWNASMKFNSKFKFKFKFKKSFISIVTYQKYKDSRDWKKPCWAYLPPSFDHNIHIHDDLIIGKTVLVQTKNILTHWPLWDLGDLTDDKSTLFQATAWCPLTTSHYLRQCCLRSILSHDITWPQWVNKYNVNRVINYACLNLLCFRKSASIHNHFDLYSQNTIWHQLWTL